MVRWYPFSVVMSYPAAKTWQVSTQAPVRRRARAGRRPRISATCSKRQPRLSPWPAVVSRRSFAFPGTFSRARSIASTTSPVPVAPSSWLPGWKMREGMPSCSQRPSSSASAAQLFLRTSRSCEAQLMR